MISVKKKKLTRSDRFVNDRTLRKFLVVYFGAIEFWVLQQHGHQSKTDLIGWRHCGEPYTERKQNAENCFRPIHS